MKSDVRCVEFRYTNAVKFLVSCFLFLFLVSCFLFFLFRVFRVFRG
jgi:hypothetical protein